MVRLLVIGVFLSGGCYAPPEVVGKVEVVAPVGPPQGRAERWVSRGVGPGVCAWRGQRFVPEDFAVLPAVPDELCIAYADCSWQVRGGGAAIEVSIHERVEPAPLPIRLTPEEARAEGLWGDATVHPVADGSLVAFDRGEFGSEIWWFAADWKRREKLAEENIVGFFELGGDVWAPGGLNHLEYPPGPVLRFSRGADGAWEASTIADQLRAGASAAMIEGETIVVATPLSVEVLEAKGSLRVLATVGWQARHPNSIARGPAGELLIGMRHVVTRLVPDAAGRFTEEWLVPTPCQEWGFVEGMNICACKGLVGEDPLLPEPVWRPR